MPPLSLGKCAPSASAGEGAGDGSPRAEELLLRVWREVTEARGSGHPLDKVVLTMEEFRRIRDWHARLGELEDTAADYIGEDSLFGLPVFISGASPGRLEPSH